MPSSMWRRPSRQRDLPILSGSVAVITLAVPATLWWGSASSQCTGLPGPLVLGAVIAGWIVTVVALPVGVGLMLSGRRLPWLAVPVGLLGLGLVAVGILQVSGRGDCLPDTATTFAGLFTVLGGLGLLGLAATLVRSQPAAGA